MRLASFPEPIRRRRGQAVFSFLLGLAMVALLIANVFLIMEYFEHFYEKNDVLADAEDSISSSQRALRDFQDADSRLQKEMEEFWSQFRPEQD